MKYFGKVQKEEVGRCVYEALWEAVCMKYFGKVQREEVGRCAYEALWEGAERRWSDSELRWVRYMLYKKIDQDFPFIEFTQKVVDEGFKEKDLSQIFFDQVVEFEGIGYFSEKDIMAQVKQFEGHIYKGLFIRKVKGVVAESNTTRLNLFNTNSISFQTNVRAMCSIQKVMQGDVLLMRKLINTIKPLNANNVEFFKYGDMDIFYNGSVIGIAEEPGREYIIGKVIGCKYVEKSENFFAIVQQIIPSEETMEKIITNQAKFFAQ